MTNELLEPPVVSPVVSEEHKRFLDYDEFKKHANSVISSWGEEIIKTEKRRITRNVNVDIKRLRESGDLEDDETFIPVRICDTNIKREQPSYIQYIKNARRLCTFRSLTEPNKDTQRLEEEFTRGMTYTKWERPHFKVLDGAQTHGWAAIEVVYDENQPLYVGHEYVAHDRLIFNMDALDIQFCDYILRHYKLTGPQLKNFVNRFQFDSIQVGLLTDKDRVGQTAKTYDVYKAYMKIDGIVYVAWLTFSYGTSAWLRAPVKFSLGRQKKITEQVPIGVDQMGQLMMGSQESWVDEDETLYPIFILPYYETEQERVIDHYGRVFMDEPKQEAQSAITSSFVNGIIRAANVYASPKAEDGSGSKPGQLDVKLSKGTILNKPFDFWNIPYPDPMIIRALQYFDVANSNEVGQVNFSAMNRKDSRKTATELEQADSQSALLNSVQLTLYSTFIREVYGFTWLIVKSLAIQSKIVFLPIKQPSNNPLNPNDITIVNDLQVIDDIYDVRAAGDVDVVQRKELEQKMLQDWPVVQNTPLRDVFLADIMKLKYPYDGARYAQILQTQSPIMQMLQLCQQMGTVIQGVMADENSPITPQDRYSLQQMLSNLASIVPQILPAVGIDPSTIKKPNELPQNNSAS